MTSLNMTTTHTHTGRPNVLIMCPWLSLDGVPGIFFREQAIAAQSFCNPILMTLQPMSLKRSIARRLGPQLQQCTTQEGLEVWNVYHPILKYTPPGIRWTAKCRLAIMRRTARLYKRAIAQHGVTIDLIHSQSIIDLAVWAHLFAIELDVPFILGEHGQCGLAGRDNAAIRSMTAAINAAARVTACSRDKLRQFAANHLFFPIESVGNMVDSRLFYASPSITPREPVRLITIGALSDFKDHRTMFAALAKVAQRLPQCNLRFTWVGCNGWGSDLSRDATRLIAEFDLGHIGVEIIPIATRDRLGALLRQSHLFVFSSISEGMPVSVLEALACGVPVVSTNCGGVDEVINQSNGRIVPVADPDRLADAIVEMIDRNRTIDSPAISKAVLDRYGTEAFTESLRQLYFAAIDTPVPGPSLL